MQNVLCPELFEEINKELGYSLKPLKSKDDVDGREEELADLSITMKRRTNRVGLLIGEAGTGKSALAGAWKNEQERNGRYIEMFELKIGLMAGDGNNKLALRMNTLLERMKQYKDELLKQRPDAKLVLFIDEVHMVVSIFGHGSKIGGDLLKDSLARAEEFVDIITATTPDEFNSYIRQDKPLARRFKPLHLNEVSPTLTFKILRSWLKRYSTEDSNISEMVSNDMLKDIIYYNKLYREGFHEPAKSIDVLDSLIATAEELDEPVSKKLLSRVFRHNYDVDLEFNVDVDNAMEIMRNDVLGQPLAMEEYQVIIETVAFDFGRSKNRPRASILLAGTTGTGKTQSAKAFTKGIYGSDDLLQIIPMTDYSSPDSEALFRKTIGDKISFNPRSVILLDELEKAHLSVIRVLLPILDEGIVTYHDEGADGRLVEHKVSLKNSIIIATSNAGAEAFNDMKRYDNNDYTGDKATDAMIKNSREIENVVIDGLQGKKMPPEFLQRFDGIVPFLSLENETLLRIARRSLKELCEGLYDEKGIHVKLPPKLDYSEAGMPDATNEDAISMYIVYERMTDDTDAGKNGARMISKIITKDILSRIIRTVREHSHARVYHLRTDGNCRFERNDSAQHEGMIRVQPEFSK